MNDDSNAIKCTNMKLNLSNKYCKQHFQLTLLQEQVIRRISFSTHMNDNDFFENNEQKNNQNTKETLAISAFLLILEKNPNLPIIKELCAKNETVFELVSMYQLLKREENFRSYSSNAQINGNNAIAKQI